MYLGYLYRILALTSRFEAIATRILLTSTLFQAALLYVGKGNSVLASLARPLHRGCVLANPTQYHLMTIQLSTHEIQISVSKHSS